VNPSLNVNVSFGPTSLDLGVLVSTLNLPHARDCKVLIRSGSGKSVDDLISYMPY